MKFSFLFFWVITATILLQGQEFLRSGTKTEIESYTPQGYALLYSTNGDLNRDAHTDLVIVYKKYNEDTELPNDDILLYRPLVLYIGQKDGTFRLAAHNDKAVLCYHCGGVMGDPFVKIAIKNGYFTIEHYGGSSWRWTRYVTFKYSKKDTAWFLHKDTSESFHSADPDNGTTTTKSVKDFGTVRFEAFDIYETH